MKQFSCLIDGKAFRKVLGGQSLGNSQGWGATHVAPTHLVCNLLLHEFIMMSHCNFVCIDARYCWWENNSALYCLVLLGMAAPRQPFAFPFSKTASYVVPLCHLLSKFLRTKLDFGVLPFGIPLKAFLADLSQWPGTEAAFVPVPFLHVFSGLLRYLCPSWGLVSFCLFSCLGLLLVSESLSASSPILELDLSGLCALLMCLC